VLRPIAVAVMVALSPMTQGAVGKQKSPQVVAAVTVYERARALAVRQRDDRAYRRLASPSLTIVNADGTRIGRAERLGQVRSGLVRPRAGQVDEHLNVRVFGNLALVSGRSSWRYSDNTLGQEYFLRVWERSNAGWHMVSGHYTEVPRKAVNPSPLVKPPFAPDSPGAIVERPVDPGRGSVDEVLKALHEQHRLYWEKNTPVYTQYIADDLLRIAEMGVRTKADLIDTMEDKLHRPRTPQVDERVHLAGNAATVTWRDAGVADDGTPTQSWFTMVFAKRSGQWQVVQIHSTRIPTDRAVPAPY
jgi:hypothetical protein